MRCGITGWIRTTALAIGLVSALGAGDVSAQDQIVIPADEAPPTVKVSKGDLELIMKAVTVQDQNQLRGRYGKGWSEGEVKQRAAITCAENAMRLIYFKPGAVDSKGRTEFAAVCQ
jgi:hypothetical protein